MTSQQAAYLSSLATETRTAKCLLWTISGFLLGGKVAKPGQKWLAKRLGCHRRTIIRAVQELQRLGYIRKVRRGWGRTNLYFLARWLWAKLAKSKTLKDLRALRDRQDPGVRPGWRGGTTKIGDLLREHGLDPPDG